MFKKSLNLLLKKSTRVLKTANVQACKSWMPLLRTITKDKRKKIKKEINLKIQLIMMMTIWSYNKTVKMKLTKTPKMSIKILNQPNQMLWLKFWFQKLMILTKFWVLIIKVIRLLTLYAIVNLSLLEPKDCIQ